MYVKKNVVIINDLIEEIEKILIVFIGGKCFIELIIGIKFLD